MHVLRKPYLLYLGDAVLKSDCKTAFGMRDWCREDVLGEWSHPSGRVTLGLPRMAPREAAVKGAGSIVIGVAPTGGQLPEHWQNDLEAALEAGLDVVSGLHTRLGSFPRLRAGAERRGVRLIDVRHPTREYPVATGQTGILIAGSGIAVDALVADFLAGAAEMLSPDNDAGHWDVIEGQGSLYHPAYAAVTVGLLHGSQPDAIVLCHDPKRTTIEEYPDYPIPALDTVIDGYLRVGALTNRAIRCVGISINSSELAEAEWRAYQASLERELGLPVCDPLRGGVAPLAAALRAI